MTKVSSHRGFLVLAASTPWVYALAQSLAASGPVTAVRFYDWANYRRIKPQWPETRSDVHRVSVCMPQGYAGSLEPVFRPLMRRIIDRERVRLRRITGAEPVIVCPYPYLAPWVRHIRESAVVYYNLDDYVLYDPPRATRITALEDEFLARADLTLCLSAHQVATLQARRPDRAAHIAHFPLGVVEDFLNPAPETPPLPDAVGYVGNLGDRVDWAFVAAVAERLSATRFHIVGSLGQNGGATQWETARRRALALPNVVYEGEVPQSQVREHYWRYAVNWMPYDPLHPFNIAACPTKIMDALASGRPFLSTDVPEVRLYPDRIGIVRTPDEAAQALQILLREGSSSAREQVAYASGHTWPHRAARLHELLENITSIGSSRMDMAASHLALREQT
ncbi:glycosyltransferase family protein [Labrys monachus]|uniref:Glycosyltransferase involved in cell wall biosynthesis n=1 Tax=Labrys monachus TaxID=217067 RepID=A0ABU0FJX7_9HYPH|nr:glycosyltransferase [Labrys monachus]MDQ0394786.1 glycosyltransferase involved in cell wall biosynthesis [Labrys monachus]